jgi:hypothetical protein
MVTVTEIVTIGLANADIIIIILLFLLGLVGINQAMIQKKIKQLNTLVDEVEKAGEDGNYSNEEVAKIFAAARDLIGSPIVQKLAPRK